MKSKKYFLTSDEIYDEGLSIEDLIEKMLNDEELETLDEVIIGKWDELLEDTQKLVDDIIKNKFKFKNIKSFFIGDIAYDEFDMYCIEQGNYEEFLKTFNDLEYLKIQGSNELKFGKINNQNLKSLEIICCGLSCNVIEEISKAELPKLEKLNLYIGLENSGYGFDGDIENIKELINSLSNFKSLKYLGINNSKIQDDIVKEVLQNNIVEQLEVLDFSNGTLSDEGGQLILDNKEKFKNLKYLDLHYHFLSDEMIKKLEKLLFKVNLEEKETDEKYGKWPMLI